MTVLIDTNVILDYVLKREGFAENALACLEKLVIAKAKIWLTASTITDIYYVSRRSLKDSDAAKGIIAKLLNSFDIATVDKSDCQNALISPMNDYEDALVSVCAKKVKADCIISRNVKDFTDSPVPVMHPIDFLNKFYP